MFIATAAIGAPLPSILYTGFGYDGANRSSYSLGGVAIGTAHAKRTLLIWTNGGNTFLGPSDPNNQVANLTVNGTPGTRVYTAPFTAFGSSTTTIWVCPLATGTTATIAFSNPAGKDLSFGAAHVFAAYHLRSATPVSANALFSGGGNFSVSQAIPTQSNGVIALWGNEVSGGTAGPFTWTNATEDADTVYSGGTANGVPYTTAHAERVAAGTRTVTLATGDECTMYWCSMR